MNKLEVLNSMKVIEYDADGTALLYLLVENTDENKNKLMSIGVPVEEIENLTGKDGETIDISSFGFRYAQAEWFHPDLGGWIDFLPES